ncbi:MAG: ergothioneine biosynthesis protein EgtB [bacterium]|nr:ergothioneine biosynthesis protein EgtB [bacterium]MCY4258618.1 ergothioneine biosynthesis protein EgtB [bacterium]
MTATLSCVGEPDAWAESYHAVRSHTERLAAPLSSEDQCIQSMADVSPTKWHRGHTTWFFETFLLTPKMPTYEVFNPVFGYLFNSYYEAVGERHPRPERGNLSRPSAAEVTTYRSYVDEAMDKLFSVAPECIPAQLLELGLHHEQQHQELLLMDIKHVLSTNQALWPAYGALPKMPKRGCLETDTLPGSADGAPASLDSSTSTELSNTEQSAWVAFAGGEIWLGHTGDGFAYDNECPSHRSFLAPYQLARSLITCQDWLDFMSDDGYKTPTLWLSDGWHYQLQKGWESPLYWHFVDDQWFEFTLEGLQPLEPAKPVCHLSYYEADAFARWAGTRLPTEAEWEHAATFQPQLLHDMFGHRWQWTASAYGAYPGFSPAPGAVGEYNGKFMANQFVLRGGSVATPAGHIRPTYRNFFHPHTRWHFSGLRLAQDAS